MELESIQLEFLQYNWQPSSAQGQPQPSSFVGAKWSACCDVFLDAGSDDFIWLVWFFQRFGKRNSPKHVDHAFWSLVFFFSECSWMRSKSSLARAVYLSEVPLNNAKQQLKSKCLMENPPDSSWTDGTRENPSYLIQGKHDAVSVSEKLHRAIAAFLLMVGGFCMPDGWPIISYT